MRRLAVALAVFGLIVSACGSNAVDTEVGEDSVSTVETTTTTGPATTVEPATTTVEPTTTTTSGPSDPLDGIDLQYVDPEVIPGVRLIDAGAEPRGVRVWNPPVGTAVAMTVITTIGSEQDVASFITTSEFSATIEAVVEVLALTDEGYISRSEFVSSSVDAADPATRAAIEAAYEALLGNEVFQVTRPDGAIVADAGLADVAGGVFDGGLGGASSPLPFEPIGIGAVWETDQVIDTQGVRVFQTVTTTLVDVVDDQLFVEIEGVVSLDPDSPALAGLSGVTLEGTTTGTAVWDLGLGLASTASSESTQVVRDESDPNTPVVVTTITRIDIEARPTG